MAPAKKTDKNDSLYKIEVRKMYLTKEKVLKVKVVKILSYESTLNRARLKASEFLKKTTSKQGYILVISRGGKKIGVLDLMAVPTDPAVTGRRRYPKQKYIPVYSPQNKTYKHYMITPSGGLTKRVHWTTEWM